MSPQARKEKEKAEAIPLLKDGMSTRDIGKLVGVSQTTVRTWAREEGIELQSAFSYSPEVKAKAAELHRKGMSAPKIAQELNISDITVRRWLSASRPPTPPVAPSPASPPSDTLPLSTPPDYRLTVKDFVRMMRELIENYERFEEKIKEYEKMAEKWRTTAGKLQEQLNSIVGSMSLK